MRKKRIFSKRKKNTKITNHRGYQIDTMKDLLIQVLLYYSNPLIPRLSEVCSLTRLYCDSHTLLLRMQIKTLTNENTGSLFSSPLRMLVYSVS